MNWRVALIDSCGEWPGVVEAAAFMDEGTLPVRRCATVADATGHGSRMARLLSDGDAEFELMVGQVFLGARPTSAAAVAAAIDWGVAQGADLIHMSLGLAADRAVLAAAVERAVEAGCIVVAAAPARGGVVYPAAYPGVIRATGDARCAPGEWSCLGPGFFGGCPRLVVGAAAESSMAAGTARIGEGGASIGAAWVTRSIVTEPKQRGARDVIGVLTAKASYRGPERRGPTPAQ